MITTGSLASEPDGTSQLRRHATYPSLVPKRTNLFQEVVELIHSHMAEGATVEASGMLPSRDTGALKEVDVVIRSRQAGHEVIVSVEAVASKRKADRNWVDKQLGRHADLPTSKLVLVSERGFTDDARAAALAQHAVPIAPEDLSGGDPTGRVIDAVKSLWPKVVNFTPSSWSVRFDDEDAPKAGWPADQPAVYADDSSLLEESLAAFVKRLFDDHFRTLIDQIGVANIKDDREDEVTIRFQNLPVEVGGVRRNVCLLNENGRIYSLKWIEVKGALRIEVSEIPLKHGRLGEVETLFSYGEGKVGGRDALVVVSAKEGEESGKLTIRVRPEVPSSPGDTAS